MWRVVVADQRSPRDGRVIETVGRYNPQTHPSEIVIDRERVDHWIARGAQPSDTVRKLLRVTQAPAGMAEPAVPSEADAPVETAEGAGTPATGGPDTVADAEGVVSGADETVASTPADGQPADSPIEEAASSASDAPGEPAEAADPELQSAQGTGSAPSS